MGTLNRTDVLWLNPAFQRSSSTVFSRLDALRIEDQLRAVLNLSGLELGFYPTNRPELKEFFPDTESLQAEIFDNDLN